MKKSIVKGAQTDKPKQSDRSFEISRPPEAKSADRLTEICNTIDVVKKYSPRMLLEGIAYIEFNSALYAPSDPKFTKNSPKRARERALKNGGFLFECLSKP